jgi:KilA-N domain
MLTKLISRDYDGKSVRINQISKLISLTDVCKATGKNVADFLRLQGTTDYIDALSCAMGIPIEKLLIVGKGNKGTWGHPQLAIKCAAWVSAKFEVLVTSWVWELLTTGKVELQHVPALPVIINQNAVERGAQFGKAVALKPFETEKLPVPDGWLTVREHLIEIVGDSDTVRQSGASYWICRNTADSYRSNTSENPPQVPSSRGGTFCYPLEYRDAIEAEWKSYTATHHEQMEQIAREQAKAHKQCSLFDLFPDIKAA